jgi:hypothetical protein
LRPLSVIIKSLTFHILIFSSELLGQLKPIFADMMFVRSSIMIPHFVLIKANHGQDEQFLFVIINFFDGIDVCFMVFSQTSCLQRLVSIGPVVPRRRSKCEMLRT